MPSSTASDSSNGVFAALLLIVVALAAFYFLQKEKDKKGKGKASASFKKIDDSYETIEQVQDALRKAGLESSSMIVGIDLTSSNTWTGRNSFGGKCLHALSSKEMNPYEEVISIVGRTLLAFDDDGMIPAYGFGDSETTDKGVRPFGVCRGFVGVLQAYRDAIPSVRLAGPTSFAPLIRQALEIVKRERSYHILLIICDGQVSDPQRSGEALVEASNYPLSVICVGVGDGPWEVMEEFDDELPARKFDNFQVSLKRVFFPPSSSVSASLSNPLRSSVPPLPPSASLSSPAVRPLQQDQRAERAPPRRHLRPHRAAGAARPVPRDPALEAPVRMFCSALSIDGCVKQKAGQIKRSNEASSQHTAALPSLSFSLSLVVLFRRQRSRYSLVNDPLYFLFLSSFSFSFPLAPLPVAAVMPAATALPTTLPALLVMLAVLMEARPGAT